MKNSQKGFVSIVLIIIVLGVIVGGMYVYSHRENKRSSGDTKTGLSVNAYRNEGDQNHKGFEINLPVGWDVKQTQQENALEIKVSAPSGGSITIYYSNYPEYKKDHQATFEEYMKIPFFKQYTTTPLVINGVAGYRVIHSETKKGGVGHDEWENGQYRIVFLTFNRTSQQDIDLMNKSRASFKFTN